MSCEHDMANGTCSICDPYVVQNLRAQLASMTKRAEEAEALLATVEHELGVLKESIDRTSGPHSKLMGEMCAAEAKLAALREAGITIDDVEAFAAFTPEAKAAYPEKPQYLIRTKGVELRQTEADAKLATAERRMEAQEACLRRYRHAVGLVISFLQRIDHDESASLDPLLKQLSALRALGIDTSKEQEK